MLGVWVCMYICMCFWWVVMLYTLICFMPMKPFEPRYVMLGCKWNWRLWQRTGAYFAIRVLKLWCVPVAFEKHHSCCQYAKSALLVCLPRNLDHGLTAHWWWAIFFVHQRPSARTMLNKRSNTCSVLRFQSLHNCNLKAFTTCNQNLSSGSNSTVCSDFAC